MGLCLVGSIGTVVAHGLVVPLWVTEEFGGIRDLGSGPHWIAALGGPTPTVIWSLVSMATYEFARVFRAFDYRTFFQHLLGRFWVLFEICYLLLLLVILAVIAAAAGTILEETFGLPYAVGSVAIMAAVGVLVFRGSVTIERFFALWSFLLYGVYLVFLVWCVIRWGDASWANLAEPAESRAWIRGGA